ncbi:redoxin domain-containing protein [Ruania alkalisoli]|uniref:Redoxin domain-containing protein n=1 Tax=Ruania alkalisoli TaxID=2779775 RepID=A0A7M1STS9_9MICO|nr:redoxin domain-containing protein [Ruania alkalisoli]QOR70871.1 redoxin domain-containing protein [Ruania alkalisoli]
MRTRWMATAALAGLLLASCAGTDESMSADDQDGMTSDEMMTEPEETSSDMTGEETPSGETEQTPSEDMADEAEPMDVPETLAFTATTLDGEPFEGATLAGTPTVLWFWAPWCPTCRAQIPNMTSLGEQYAGEVNVVGVGGLDTAEAIADLAGDIPNLQHLVDDDGEVWSHFGITYQSTYVVLDSHGEIVDEGTLSDEELNAAVAELT